ncbi:50S ribosomal protein L13 [Candidatus Woesearchaeota archaeon]|nr:50S ribosomal protein L13 [Candidatus Woesearchaeota archaeon]
MIINAKDLILGRLGAFVAKKALLGEEIKIVNCKDAVIVGKKDVVINRYKKKQRRTTPRKGPFIPKTSDRFVKRTIRGMLPYKKGRGRDAFKRIICYKSVPESLKNKEIINMDSYNVLQTNNENFIRVEEICRQLGGKE